MDTGTGNTGERPPLDVDGVRQLLATMEADLARIGEGSASVETLRDEVRRLGALLESPAPADAHVEHGLHGLRARIERGIDAVVDEAIRDARYLAEIGRLLGL